MIKFLILYLTVTMFSPIAFAKTLKVAVVDTGIDLLDSRLNGKFCGYKDFTGTGMQDRIGHGTHVVGLIEKYAGKGDYCLLIYKFYSENVSAADSASNEELAFQEAIRNGVDMINFSAGGPIFNEKEYLIIRDNPNTIFVVAAGNDGKNLDVPGNGFYPASHFLKNEIVVGNWDSHRVRMPSSNYGSKVVVYENGDNILSTLPNDKIGYLTGTSMSTATHTGKLIKEMINARQSVSK